MAESNNGIDLTEHREGRDKPTGALIKDLTGQMTTLIHEEMELARVEMAAKAKLAGAGAGAFGVAAVAGLLGAGALVAAAIAGIANVLPVWLSALIIGGALLIAAGLAALAGRASLSRATPPVPEQAITTTKEDVEWLKAQTRSARR